MAANEIFREEVANLIQENSGKDSFDTGEYQEDFNAAGNSIGLSIGGATVRIRGTKMPDGSWMIEFGGKDTYDFTQWKEGSSKADVANNIAYIGQGLGVIKPYPVQFSGAFVYPAK